ncbi:MAG: hypothetical protein IKG39_11395, partial [Lachnospiraceae bacterium]|nr:hypothetical protein [Lachnospiraceae bacterium]
MEKSAGANVYTLKNIIAHEKRLFSAYLFYAIIKLDVPLQKKRRKIMNTDELIKKQTNWIKAVFGALAAIVAA